VGLAQVQLHVYLDADLLEGLAKLLGGLGRHCDVGRAVHQDGGREGQGDAATGVNELVLLAEILNNPRRRIPVNDQRR
jgi:hypothetical protein